MVYNEVNKKIVTTSTEQYDKHNHLNCRHVKTNYGTPYETW